MKIKASYKYMLISLNYYKILTKKERILLIKIKISAVKALKLYQFSSSLLLDTCFSYVHLFVPNLVFHFLLIYSGPTSLTQNLYGFLHHVYSVISLIYLFLCSNLCLISPFLYACTELALIFLNLHILNVSIY